MIPKVTRALKNFITPLKTSVSGSNTSTSANIQSQSAGLDAQGDGKDQKDKKKEEDVKPELETTLTRETAKSTDRPGLTSSDSIQPVVNLNDLSIPETLIKLKAAFEGFRNEIDASSNKGISYQTIRKSHGAFGQFRKGTMVDRKIK